MSLVGASFVAAVSIGTAAHILAMRTGIPQDVLDVAGCIAIIPGSFAAKAIIGLFALITGAIGTDLAVPVLLFRVRTSP